MANSVRFSASLDDKVSTGLGKIRDKFEQLGGKGSAASLFGNVGAAAVAKGFGLIDMAAGAVVGGITDSIDAASHLNETMSKSAVVFGTSSKEVAKWGDTAATAMGLSKQQAVEAAASLGNLFNGLDETKGKSVEMSESTVQLAADLSSFNDLAGGAPEALDKLRSGLAGESEPLRSMGIFLTEAKVKAKAMEMGLAGAHGELTEGAKVAARYQLILEETQSAQGDFARTSDSLANKQRQNDAKMADAMAKLGGVLLPLVTAAAGAFGDSLSFIVDNSGAVLAATAAIGAALVASMVPGLIASVTASAAAAGGFGALAVAELAALAPFAAIGLAIGAVVLALTHMTEIGNAVTAFIGAIPGPWQDAAVKIDDSAVAISNSLIEAGKTPDALAADLRESKAQMGIAANTGIKKPIVDAAQGAHDGAVNIIKKTPADIANALRAGRQQWLDAGAQLETDLKNPMTRAAEMAKIKAELFGSNLATGLKSKDPVIKAEAEAYQRLLRERLVAMQTDAKGYGAATGRNYAAGLTDSAGAVTTAAKKIANIPKQYLKVSSPAEKGPLSEAGGIGAWGAKAGALFAAGLQGNLPNLSGALGGMPAMAMAGGSGTVVSGRGGYGYQGGGGGGAPVVIQLNLDGREVSRLVDERLYYAIQRASPARSRS